MRLPYLALLQVGFAVPSRVTTDAVRSYRTVSPLPVPRGTWAVCSLLHFPWARAPQALPGTRSAGARTFLHRSEASAATARPTLVAHDTAAHAEVKWRLHSGADGLPEPGERVLSGRVRLIGKLRALSAACRAAPRERIRSGARGSGELRRDGGDAPRGQLLRQHLDGAT